MSKKLGQKSVFRDVKKEGLPTAKGEVENTVNLH